MVNIGTTDPVSMRKRRVKRGFQNGVPSSRLEGVHQGVKFTCAQARAIPFRHGASCVGANIRNSGEIKKRKMCKGIFLFERTLVYLHHQPTTNQRRTMMITNDRKQELNKMYGSDTVDTALAMMVLSDPDGAWAMAMDEGMVDVAEVIEELMEEEEDV